MKGLRALRYSIDPVLRQTTYRRPRRKKFCLYSGAVTGDAPWFRKGLAIKANIYRDPRNDDLIFDFAPVASGYGWIFPKRDHVNIGLYCLDIRANISVVLGCLITSSTALG